MKVAATESYKISFSKSSYLGQARDLLEVKHELNCLFLSHLAAPVNPCSRNCCFYSFFQAGVPWEMNAANEAPCSEGKGEMTAAILGAS